jgi:hypothetical protein
MCRVVLFNHLHTCPTILGDLIDVGAFEEAQADARMAQTIGRSRPASRSVRSLSSSRMALNKSRGHLGNRRSVRPGSWHSPLAMDLVRLPDLPGPPSGRRRFFSRSNGRTAPAVLLQ